MENQFQGEVPMHNFAVHTTDVVSYQAGQEIKLPVEVRNAGLDKYKINLDLDVPYLSRDDKLVYHNCLLTGNEDIACRYSINRKYISSMNLDVSIYSQVIKPVGYTRVYSIHRDNDALVKYVKLTRVLSILSTDQMGKYPDNFFDIKALDNTCFYSQTTCVARCIAYGDHIDDTKIIIQRGLNGELRELVMAFDIKRESELGQTSVSTEFNISSGQIETSFEQFFCRYHQKDDNIIEASGLLTYKTRTQVVREKSFFEFNEEIIQITCVAISDNEPGVSALLSIKHGDKVVELKYRNREIIKLGPGEVKGVFYYNHGLGGVNLEDVTAKCYARSNSPYSYDLDRFTLTDMSYLEQ